LKAHQEMLHRPSEAVKVTRQDSDAEWRVRAESITTDSHLDRAQLAKLFVMQQSNPTEIDCKVHIAPDCSSLRSVIMHELMRGDNHGWSARTVFLYRICLP